eukprot:971523-Pyramimonas_sp.AAC.1
MVELLIRGVMQLYSFVLARHQIKARIAFPAVECAGRPGARSDRSFMWEGGQDAARQEPCACVSAIASALLNGRAICWTQ